MNDLKDITVGEVNQTQKNKYCMIPFIRSTQDSQIYKEKELEVTRGWVQIERVLPGREFLFRMKKKFWRCTVVIVAQRECCA